MLRKILFAVSHLPEDMPKYWQTIQEFSKAELPLSELKTAMKNLEFLNKAAFSTDEQLLKEICSTPIGVILISTKQKCGECKSKLVTRADI